MPEEEQKIGPEFYTRNQYGLLENTEYAFNKDGSVNWRAMIPKEYLYVRDEWFKSRGQDVPISVEGLEDEQLTIMLGGFKGLAKLRGYKQVEFEVKHVATNYVAAKCRITWTGNYETSNNEVIYEEVGNASGDNTNNFCQKFLETIACNRAFVRCVRNFLNIHVVGMDELDNSSGDKISEGQVVAKKTVFTPTEMLQEAVKEKLGVDFEGFKSGKLQELLDQKIYKNTNTDQWQSFGEIPTKDARRLLGIIKKLKKA